VELPVERNPYAPPQTSLDVIEGPSAWQPASRWQRVANLIVDTVGYVVLTVVMIGLIGVVDFEFAETVASEGSSSAQATYVVYMLSRMSYYFGFEAFFGWTPAKLLTRTRVVNTDGSQLTWLRAIARTLLRFVPFEMVTFLGHFSAGLHDQASGTRVVRLPQELPVRNDLVSR